MLKVVRNLFPCVCLFLVFAFLFLGANPTHASENLNASVGIEPSLTLTLPTAALNLALDPSTTTFGYKDLPISVATNNETGYIMTVSTAGNNTDLVNTTDSNIVLETLPTLTGGYTDSTFVVNKWGYKNGLANNYFPFQSGATVLQNAGPTNGDSTTLRFGTKIDYMQPEGTYSTTFNFALVVNPVVRYMQDLRPAACTATPQTVIDSRDGKEYTIARLADGQCWMTSNLNLAGGTVLNANTSDVPTNNYYTLPTSSASGFSSDTTAYVYNTGNETTSQADCTSSQACNSYYSWLAATAGGKDADGNAITGTGIDAAYSICPKGWRLPKAGNQNDTSATSTTGYKKGDFYKLATAYGASLESSPYQSSNVFYNNVGPNTTPNFLAGGYYYTSAYRDGGTAGWYWASSSVESSYGGLLSFSSTSFRTANDNSYGLRRDGFSVRCVMREGDTTSDITNMQDINLQTVINTLEGATATLKDARDNQEYTVAKIKGNVWMTRNLAIGCDGSGSTYGSNITSKTLTPADTNITAASWATPTNDLTVIGNTLTDPAMMCSSTYGAWYNYVAATAGTITGSSNSTNATVDICPAGWRLATYTEQSGIINSVSLFSPVVGGYYYAKNNSDTNKGWYWASTANGGTGRYRIVWDGSTMVANSANYREDGFYVRCIAKY